MHMLRLALFAILAISLNTCSSTTIRLTESCVAGTYVLDGDIPPPADVAQDAYCAKKIVERVAPRGVITIFGSARVKEGIRSYDMTRKFAFLWTKQFGTKYPILTGGGPGVMEAGNRGATEAGGRNIGFTTYFRSGSEKKPNTFATDTYVFSSFSQREAEMVDRAAAVIVAQGGSGTEWEIFETLSKIQTRKKNVVPVILLGSRAEWKTLFDRIDTMIASGTVTPDNLLQVAETPEAAVEMLKAKLP